MTINCNNCGVAEMRINGVEYARRNCHWWEITTCFGLTCICDVANPEDYENLPLKTWVDLPAGINTIEVYGVRIGRTDVESQLEAAVWRKECPPVTTNVICVPPEVIAEQGLCEFERLAALYGTMVGCLQVSANCQQGPDTYIADLVCLPRCLDEGCDGCGLKDPPLPGGAVLMNTITLNYPYDIRVHLDWHTAFVQDAVGACIC